MIAGIILLIGGFTWLLIETRFLSIRLLVGAIPLIPLEPVERRDYWDNLKPRSNLARYPFWIRHPESMAPLCGWSWLKDTHHIIPEYNIDLNIGGVRYKMNIKENNILKDVMKANKLTKAQRLAYAG